MKKSIAMYGRIAYVTEVCMFVNIMIVAGSLDNTPFYICLIGLIPCVIMGFIAYFCELMKDILINEMEWRKQWKLHRQEKHTFSNAA